MRDNARPPYVVEPPGIGETGRNGDVDTTYLVKGDVDLTVDDLFKMVKMVLKSVNCVFFSSLFIDAADLLSLSCLNLPFAPKDNSFSLYPSTRSLELDRLRMKTSSSPCI